MLKRQWKTKADKPIHSLTLQAKHGLANAQPDFKKLRVRPKFQTKLVRLTAIKMKPTLGTSIPFPASLACQLKTNELLNYFVGCNLQQPKKCIFKQAFAELLSFPKWTMGELQPFAKDSVQGIPIAAIISVPISGRQCFWLHLGQKKAFPLWAKNPCLFLMFGCRTI